MSLKRWTTEVLLHGNLCSRTHVLGVVPLSHLFVLYIHERDSLRWPLGSWSEWMTTEWLRRSPAPSEINVLHDCDHSVWRGKEIYLPRSYNVTCVLHLHFLLQPSLCSTPSSDVNVKRSGRCLRRKKKHIYSAGLILKFSNFTSLKCVWLLEHRLKAILLNDNLQGRL